MEWMPGAASPSTPVPFSTPHSSTPLPSSQDISPSAPSAAPAGDEDPLAAAFALLDANSDGRLAPPELEILLSSLNADVAAPAVLQIADEDKSGSLDLPEIRRALAAHAFHREETGRYRVAVSLAEAEAVRALLHAASDAQEQTAQLQNAQLQNGQLQIADVQNGAGGAGRAGRADQQQNADRKHNAGRKQNGVLPGSRAAVALIVGPDGPIIDAAGGWRPAGAAQDAAAGAALRFFNSGEGGLLFLLLLLFWGGGGGGAA
jgi:hypothetical protein